MGRFDNREKNELVFITEQYLTPYLTFIKENQRIFKVAIKQFRSMNLNEVYERMFSHIFSPILARFNVPEKSRAYVMKFYLTGVYAIVMEWLRNDCADEMDAIIGVIIDCVLGERRINE